MEIVNIPAYNANNPAYNANIISFPNQVFTNAFTVVLFCMDAAARHLIQYDTGRRILRSLASPRGYRSPDRTRAFIYMQTTWGLPVVAGIYGWPGMNFVTELPTREKVSSTESLLRSYGWQPMTPNEICSAVGL